MPVSEETYRRIALEDPEGQWELCHGRLRSKPGMTAAHNNVASRLFGRLWQQLDEDRFMVRYNAGHIQRSADQYYIPDLCVIPTELMRPLLDQLVLETYSAPLPLVVEVWSPSTGEYDVEQKFPEYRRRGNLEIWRIHPYERTLIAWVRQPDGSYAERLYTSGTIQLAALPGVTINVASLFG